MCTKKRASAYAIRRDDDHAIADFTAALRLQPQTSTTYYDRGLSYTKAGSHAQAIGDYSAAIRLNAKYESAFYMCALEYQDGPIR